MAERRAVLDDEIEAIAEVIKPSNEEVNDGEGKGNEESVKREKESENDREDNDVDMEGERKNDEVSHSERGDTRQVIIKDENGESMEMGEQD